MSNRLLNIVFIQEFYYPNYPTMVLSAILKKQGHQVRIFLGKPDKIQKQLLNYHESIDLICFSILTLDRLYMIKTVRLIKSINPSWPIIVGGVDAILEPNELAKISELDFICIGEGEELIVQLTERISRGTQDYYHIHNLWYRNQDHSWMQNTKADLQIDLDSLPYADRELYLDADPIFKDYPFYVAWAGRGCRFACAYCFNSKLKKQFNPEVAKKYFRHRSAENCIAELAMVKEKYKPNIIYFYDDSALAYDDDFVHELFRQYRDKIKIPFSINANIDEIEDELMGLLVEAGCFQVRIGLETGNQDLRIRILKKPHHNETFIAKAAILKKHKLSVVWNYMLGLPEENLPQSFETIELMQKVNVSGHNFGGLFIPFPNLPIIDNYLKDLEKRDLLKADFFKADRFEKNFIFSKDHRQIRNLLYLSPYAINYPVLYPLIKVLIHLHLAPIYNTLYILFKFYTSMIKTKGMKPSFIIHYLLKNGTKVN